MIFNNVNKLIVGSNNVSKVYLGSNAVWGWNPYQMASVFWYDPSDSSTITTSGSTVTQVTDKSGNGYNLSVATAGFSGPTIGNRKLNGLNVFEYATPSNSQVLENNSFTYNQSTTPLNIMLVVRCDNEGLTEQDFIFSGTESTASNSTRIALRRLDNNSLQILSSTLLGTATILTEGTDFLINARFNATNSEIRVNGATEATGDIGTTQFSSLNIGANEAETQSIEGYIAEIIGFADNSKTETVEGYLAWKWGLVNKLPSNHPYKQTRP